MTKSDKSDSLVALLIGLLFMYIGLDSHWNRCRHGKAVLNSPPCGHISALRGSILADTIPRGIASKVWTLTPQCDVKPSLHKCSLFSIHPTLRTRAIGYYHQSRGGTYIVPIAPLMDIQYSQSFSHVFFSSFLPHSWDKENDPHTVFSAHPLVHKSTFYQLLLLES